MPLPPYYLEVILVSGVACLDTMMMNGRGGLQVLFVSFTKGPGGFPYVLFITAYVTTLVPVDGINYILDNTSQQLEECRSQLVAIIPAQRLRECQDFVDKVGEIRFNKVKQRQLNKFNLLINRKEGNITRSNNTNSNTNNLTIQLGSQINHSNQINQTTTQANPPHLRKEVFLPWQVIQ